MSSPYPYEHEETEGSVFSGEDAKLQSVSSIVSNHDCNILPSVKTDPLNEKLIENVPFPFKHEKDTDSHDFHILMNAMELLVGSRARPSCMQHPQLLQDARTILSSILSQFYKATTNRPKYSNSSAEDVILDRDEPYHYHQSRVSCSDDVLELRDYLLVLFPLHQQSLKNFQEASALEAVSSQLNMLRRRHLNLSLSPAVKTLRQNSTIDSKNNLVVPVKLNEGSSTSGKFDESIDEINEPDTLLVSKASNDIDKFYGDDLDRLEHQLDLSISERLLMDSSDTNVKLKSEYEIPPNPEWNIAIEECDNNTSHLGLDVSNDSHSIPSPNNEEAYHSSSPTMFSSSSTRDWGRGSVVSSPELHCSDFSQSPIEGYAGEQIQSPDDRVDRPLVTAGMIDQQDESVPDLNQMAISLLSSAAVRLDRSGRFWQSIWFEGQYEVRRSFSIDLLGYQRAKQYAIRFRHLLGKRIPVLPRPLDESQTSPDASHFAMLWPGFDTYNEIIGLDLFYAMFERYCAILKCIKDFDIECATQPESKKRPSRRPRVSTSERSQKRSVQDSYEDQLIHSPNSSAKGRPKRRSRGSRTAGSLPFSRRPRQPSENEVGAVSDTWPSATRGGMHKSRGVRGSSIGRTHVPRIKGENRGKVPPMPSVSIGLTGHAGGLANLTKTCGSPMYRQDYSTSRLERLSRKATEFPYVHGVSFEPENFAWVAKMGNETRRFLVKKYGWEKARLYAVGKIESWRKTLEESDLSMHLVAEKAVLEQISQNQEDSANTQDNEKLLEEDKYVLPKAVNIEELDIKNNSPVGENIPTESAEIEIKAINTIVDTLPSQTLQSGVHSSESSIHPPINELVATSDNCLNLEPTSADTRRTGRGGRMSAQVRGSRSSDGNSREKRKAPILNSSAPLETGRKSIAAVSGSGLSRKRMKQDAGVCGNAEQNAAFSDQSLSTSENPSMYLEHELSPQPFSGPSNISGLPRPLLTVNDPSSFTGTSDLSGNLIDEKNSTSSNNAGYASLNANPAASLNVTQLPSILHSATVRNIRKNSGHSKQSSPESLSRHSAVSSAVNALPSVAMPHPLVSNSISISASAAIPSLSELPKDASTVLKTQEDPSQLHFVSGDEEGSTDNTAT